MSSEGQGTFQNPGESGTFKAADEVHLPVSRPDGTVSHPRCGLCQTSRERGPEVSHQVALKSHTFPRQDVPLLQTPQLIVLRTKAFDGFIVPKFTTGANNFRAGRECRAGRAREVNGPGSRQEIATYNSSKHQTLPLKVSPRGGGGGFHSSGSPGCRAKRIKVVLTFQSPEHTWFGCVGNGWPTQSTAMTSSLEPSVIRDLNQQGFEFVPTPGSCLDQLSQFASKRVCLRDPGLRQEFASCTFSSLLCHISSLHYAF